MIYQLDKLHIAIVAIVTMVFYKLSTVQKHLFLPIGSYWKTIATIAKDIGILTNSQSY